MKTVKGRVLLGWMARDAAIRCLLDDCFSDPPLDAAAAEAVWQGYRSKVAALPPRVHSVASNVGLTPIEAGHSKNLATFFAANNHADMVGVRKVDLRELTVHQYYVVTDRADEYAKTVGDPNHWNTECLPLVNPNGQFEWRHQLNGLSAYIEYDVPHGEWTFAHIGNGSFAPAPGLRHVTVRDAPDRTFLWAGYHRSFAKVLTTPTANAPTALVALARNVTVPPVAGPGIPGVATNGVDEFSFFGAKAAKFGDFFVDGLFMEVDLRKKRYQLQVHANWVAIDDPT